MAAPKAVMTGKHNVSEAKRNAEALFETKPVAEIREVALISHTTFLCCNRIEQIQ